MSVVVAIISACVSAVGTVTRKSLSARAKSQEGVDAREFSTNRKIFMRNELRVAVAFCRLCGTISESSRISTARRNWPPKSPGSYRILSAYFRSSGVLPSAREIPHGQAQPGLVLLR